MQRLAVTAFLVVLAVSPRLGADDAADLRRMLEVAPDRLREERQAVGDGAPALPADRAPASAPDAKQFLCPVDHEPLRELAPPAEPGAPAAAAWLCARERVLYVQTPAREAGSAPTWRGPVQLFPATREAVLRVLQRHLSDTGQQGFYSNRFQDLRLAGREAAPQLLSLYREETNEQVRQLALDAVGEVGNPLVIPELVKIAAHPGNPSDRQGAAVAAARLGDRTTFDQFVGELRVTADDPDRSPRERGGALSGLALLYARLDEHDKALACYLQARDLVPSEPVVHYNLGCTYALLGKKEEAFRELDAALEVGFDQWEWIRMDGDLESLHADPRWEKLLDRLSKRRAGGAGGGRDAGGVEGPGGGKKPAPPGGEGAEPEDGD
ncbi:MAG: hypothetical protein HYZ53_10410 [Planctomycetes bacterium]|nr:hypothetical protein [Planctomycetota bacterium]